MKTQELKQRLQVLPAGYGTYKVTDLKTGKWGITHNMSAIDRIKCDNVSERTQVYLYTYKQALQSLFNEITR